MPRRATSPTSCARPSITTTPTTRWSASRRPSLTSRGDAAPASTKVVLFSGRALGMLRRVPTRSPNAPAPQIEEPHGAFGQPVGVSPMAGDHLLQRAAAALDGLVER